MSGGREVTSEQSSLICEGAGYDQVYPSGCELEEDLTWSPTRESSAYSFVEGEEGYEEDEEGNVEREKGDEEEEEEEMMTREMRVTGGVKNIMAGR